MDNEIQKSKELKLSQDKKLLYEFLDSYPKIATNKSNKNINNQNNSIDTLINFMQFMNSKNKIIGNKKEKEIKNNTTNNKENEKEEIIQKPLNTQNNNEIYEDINNKVEKAYFNGRNKKISALNYSRDKSNDLSNDIVQENIPTKSSETKRKKKIDKLFSNISSLKKDEGQNKNNLFHNYQYQAVIDEANQILQNKYKVINTDKNNDIILPDVLYPEMLIEKMKNDDIKADEETYKEKVYELNKERVKNKNEKKKKKKLKINYDTLYNKLQNEINKFNMSNQKKLENFNKYKNDEIEKIEKEKKQLILEQKEIGELRIKYQMNNKLNNKKDKEDIIQLKKRFQKFYEENKSKENNSKILIEKYKRQLDEANNKILMLNNEITKLQIQTKQYKEEEQYNFEENDKKSYEEKSPRFNTENENNKNEIEKEIINTDINSGNSKNEIENYDLVFPNKYHKQKYKLINTAKTEDGKKINFYDKNKKEIIFKSGVKKEIYYDGYQIIYFTNGDIKQIYPEKSKQVYFFNESKIIQTTIPDKIQVFKFENGQIEKHYINGIKEIIFPNGDIKRIYKDGKEENININSDNEEYEYEEIE